MEDVESQTIQLFLQLPTGETKCLDVVLDASLRRIRLSLEERGLWDSSRPGEAVPRFFSGSGRSLQEDDTVSALGLANGSLVHLSMSLLGGAPNQEMEEIRRKLRAAAKVKDFVVLERLLNEAAKLGMPDADLRGFKDTLNHLKANRFSPQNVRLARQRLEEAAKTKSLQEMQEAFDHALAVGMVGSELTRFKTILNSLKRDTARAKAKKRERTDAHRRIARDRFNRAFNSPDAREFILSCNDCLNHDIYSEEFIDNMKEQWKAKFGDADFDRYEKELGEEDFGDLGEETEELLAHSPRSRPPSPPPPPPRPHSPAPKAAPEPKPATRKAPNLLIKNQPGRQSVPKAHMAPKPVSTASPPERPVTRQSLSESGYPVMRRSIVGITSSSTSATMVAKAVAPSPQQEVMRASPSQPTKVKKKPRVKVQRDQAPRDFHEPEKLLDQAPRLVEEPKDITPVAVVEPAKVVARRVSKKPTDSLTQSAAPPPPRPAPAPVAKRTSVAASPPVDEVKKAPSVKKVPSTAKREVQAIQKQPSVQHKKSEVGNALGKVLLVDIGTTQLRLGWSTEDKPRVVQTTNGRTARDVIDKYLKELGPCDCNATVVLLTEDTRCRVGGPSFKEKRELTARQLILDDSPSRFAGLHIANTAVLSLMASGKRSGLVIDIGTSVCITPVYELAVIDQAVRTLEFPSGADCDRFLTTIVTDLSKDDNPITRAQEVKEYCATAMHYRKQHQAAKRPEEEESEVYGEFKPQAIKLHSKSSQGTVSVCEQLFAVAELYFQPALASQYASGNKIPSKKLKRVPEALLEAAMATDPQIRNLLLSNVCLAGRGSLFPDFEARLTMEMAEILPPVYDLEISRVESQKGNMSAYMGAKELANSASFQNSCVWFEEVSERCIEMVSDIF